MSHLHKYWGGGQGYSAGGMQRVCSMLRQGSMTGTAALPRSRGSPSVTAQRWWGARNVTRSPSYAAPTQEEIDNTEQSKISLLPMQNINVMGVGEKKKNCVAFFNTGSNIKLVWRAFL